MPAVAMTDHGNMFGAVEFYRPRRSAGSADHRLRDVRRAAKPRRADAVRADDYETGGNFHLILLAMNHEGYRNLCRLVSRLPGRASTTSRASTRSCCASSTVG